MARIAGVDLPRRKHLAFALPYLYGIGKTLAKQICKKAMTTLLPISNNRVHPLLRPLSGCGRSSRIGCDRTPCRRRS